MKIDESISDIGTLPILKANGGELDYRLDNLENAIPKQSELIEGVQDEVNACQADLNRKLEGSELPVKVTFSEGKGIVYINTDSPRVTYNNREVRFLGDGYIDGQGVFHPSETPSPYTPVGSTLVSYSRITPAAGMWYMWFNSCAYNNNKSNSDQIYAYVAHESALPSINNDVCRRPEMQIFPIFKMRLVANAWKIEYVHDHNITLMHDERFVPFQLAAYFYPGTITEYETLNPTLAYAVYDPKFTVNCYGDESEVKADGIVTTGRTMVNKWVDIGRYPFESERQDDLVVYCTVYGTVSQGKQIWPPVLEDETSTGETVKASVLGVPGSASPLPEPTLSESSQGSAVSGSGEEEVVTKIYQAKYALTAFVGYSRYNPPLISGSYEDMFSFPIAGNLATNIIWAQCGYNDDDQCKGTEYDQIHFVEMFANRVDVRITCCGEACTHDNMLASILVAVKYGELALITYSGHGGADEEEQPDGTIKWVNHRFQLPDGNGDLYAQEVADVIIEYAIGRVWLIYDACYGGGHFDHEYDDDLEATLARGFINEVVDRVAASGKQRVKLLGWAAAPEDKVAWGYDTGGEFVTAMYDTYDADNSYINWWNSTVARCVLDEPFKKACNGFDESARFLG